MIREFKNEGGANVTIEVLDSIDFYVDLKITVNGHQDYLMLTDLEFECMRRLMNDYREENPL